jgi:phospholipase/lecithinase/hemolysin
MIQNYNHALGRRAGWFAADHPGTNSMVFDTYSYLSKILKHPLDYGIKNTTDFCRSYAAPDITTNYTAYGCLPINEYFWYNSGHITYRVHELLAGGIDTFLRSQKKA